MSSTSNPTHENARQKLRAQAGNIERQRQCAQEQTASAFLLSSAHEKDRLNRVVCTSFDTGHPQTGECNESICGCLPSSGQTTEDAVGVNAVGKVMEKRSGFCETDPRWSYNTKIKWSTSGALRSRAVFQFLKDWFRISGKRRWWQCWRTKEACTAITWRQTKNGRAEPERKPCPRQFLWFWEQWGSFVFHSSASISTVYSVCLE